MVSSPALYPEFFQPPVRIIEGENGGENLPQGFAKIKVGGQFLEEWIDFIDSNGFLRRDKINNKFIQLLARAAAKPEDSFTPIQVDESIHCGSPGKIVDPITLCQILQTSPSQQFFYGSGNERKKK